MKWTVHFLVSSVCLVTACSRAGSAPQQDPRIVLFEKFNRAISYAEIRPLLSDVLATQLEQVHAKQPSDATKVLDRLKLASYDPRVVDINDNTSFLVLDSARSSDGRIGRQAYLLARLPDKGWTLANRVPPESIVKSLWKEEHAPGEFNQASTCSVSGRQFPSSINGKQWAMQSAGALRDKDKIEIDLYPFPVSHADLDHLKYMGVVQEQAAAQDSSISKPHSTCRIVLGLDPSSQIKSVNLGFDSPDVPISILWQSSDIPKMEINKNRIKIQTAGSVDAGNTIRWNCKIDVPLLYRGL